MNRKFFACLSFLCFIFLLMIQTCSYAEKTQEREGIKSHHPKVQENFRVHETRNEIWVKVWAPIPEEVENVVQAKALSRDAAILVGQRELLAYVLKKKARSKKTLALVEVPDLKLQENIRAIIKGAQVTRTRWDKGKCWVTLAANRKNLAVILKQN